MAKRIQITDITEEQHSIIEKAAKIVGSKKNSFILSEMLKLSNKIIENYKKKVYK